jgi:hypothetical protein
MGKEGGSAGGRYGGIAGGRAMAERGSGAEPATQRLHCRRYHWLPDIFYQQARGVPSLTEGCYVAGEKKGKTPKPFSGARQCKRSQRTPARAASVPLRSLPVSPVGSRAPSRARCPRSDAVAESSAPIYATTTRTESPKRMRQSKRCVHSWLSSRPRDRWACLLLASVPPLIGLCTPTPF